MALESQPKHVEAWNFVTGHNLRPQQNPTQKISILSNIDFSSWFELWPNIAELGSVSTEKFVRSQMRHTKLYLYDQYQLHES